MHPAYDINFVYFLPDFPSRVVKFDMVEMHKVKGGGVYIGDPMKMSPSLGIVQAERWYKFYSGKTRQFKTAKCGQFDLYKLLMKKAKKLTEEDMKNLYKTQTLDIPKPNNHCKTVRGRDPWETDWTIELTDKKPLSQKIKNRLSNYIDSNKGKLSIELILELSDLNINDIKYDIKLGYIKAYRLIDGKKKYK